MKIIKFIAISFILLGNFPFENLVYAEVKKPEDYKVLTKNNKKLSVSNIKYYIKEGDDFIMNSNFEKAKESYLNATFEKLEIIIKNKDLLAGRDVLIEHGGKKWETTNVQLWKDNKVWRDVVSVRDLEKVDPI